MTRTVRPATADDIPRMVELLMQDARARHALDPVLWALADDAPERIEDAIVFALTALEQPFPQAWLVAADGPALAGVVHAMHLPVPPIYAGRQGPPGLILPDSFAAPDALEGTVEALVEAAEADLRAAGARVVLASFVTGGAWRCCLDRRGYEALTLYLARTDLGDARPPTGVRPATEEDVPGIVARSAEHRAILAGLDPFWEIHPEADARFDRWMRRSLTLADRDMRVAGPPDALEGYVIAQPASRLHVPPAHAIAGTGVIDDFHHADLADPSALADGGAGASALLRSAEAAFADRGVGASLVVCPAAWRSKVKLLEAAGYETAMVWQVKR